VVSRARVYVLCPLFGAALGFFAAEAGFGDLAYVRSAFSLERSTGAFPGLFLAFGAAVILAGLGFRLLARHDALPERPLHRGTIPGGVAFGAGWALSGGCPAIVLVQLGQGRVAALAVFAGTLPGFFLARWAKRRFRIDGGSCGG
jgi:uncharacterized membrane protein YedE/YeeE